MVKFDAKAMSESESKYKINEGYIEIRKKNVQSSYNLDKNFCDYVEEKNILVEDPNLDYPRKDKDGNAFVLNEEYQLELGPGVLWLIGKEYSTRDNKFISSHNDNGKIQVYNNVYKNMGPDYEWFHKVYEKSIAGNVLEIDIDEEQKKFTVDIRFDSIEESISTNELDYSIDDEINLPYNRIVFGAPGTGKSYELNKDKEKFKGRYERVTFHPNYSYSQFVGTYKPVPVKDKEGNKTNDITYEYVPGPFMRAFVKATNSKQPYLLLIEEINRANVTSVFGDVFQLLDRENGISEYPIETSEDMRDYLDEKITKEDFDSERIFLPKNMYIWASMNSADQGVFPMDTAFKRRWEFEYIGIDDNIDEIKNITVEVGKDKHIVKWNDLRTAINNKLSNDYKINEDKLLGPYFLSKDILDTDETDIETREWKSEPPTIKDNKKFLKAFKSKVLMYLFEDVAKQYGPKLFEECDEPTKYSSICKEFDEKGEEIFGKNFINKYANTENE